MIFLATYVSVFSVPHSIFADLFIYVRKCFSGPRRCAFGFLRSSSYVARSGVGICVCVCVCVCVCACASTWPGASFGVYPFLELVFEKVCGVCAYAFVIDVEIVCHRKEFVCSGLKFRVLKTFVSLDD